MVCTETGETHTMLVDTSDVCREKMEQLLKAIKTKNSSSFSKNIENLKSCEK